MGDHLALFASRKMLLRGLCLFTVCVFLVKADTASARSSLAGLKRLTLLVEGLSEDDRYCGITENQIRDALKREANSVGLELVEQDDPTGVIFYVSVSSVRMPEGICATTITEKVYYYSTQKLPYRDKPDVAVVEVWEQRQIGVGGPAASARSIPAAVGALTRNFIADWKQDN